MKPADAIYRYNRLCNECSQYENNEARHETCTACLIELARNMSIKEQLNGGVRQ